MTHGNTEEGEQARRASEEPEPGYVGTRRNGASVGQAGREQSPRAEEGTNGHCVWGRAICIPQGHGAQNEAPEAPAGREGRRGGTTTTPGCLASLGRPFTGPRGESPPLPGRILPWG
ncbi:UNVERIFIED_CONTAM: hypothetical protein K2H54_017904 [Gekko kuhli]